jgi:arylsulfatase A-like enzyme
MRQFRLVQLSVAILALLTFVRPMPASEQRSAAGLAARPNIVFILADDLGYGDLSCYGQTQFRTPNIDRLAAQGARFTNFYAGSTVCAPSRCVLMTGLHTGHCTIRGNGSVNLRPEDVTVAEVLGRAGYRTGLIGKWGLGAENSTGIPTRKGFDRFFGYLDQTHAHNYYPTFLYSDDKRVQLQNVVPKEGRMGQGVATKRIDYSPDLMTREALAFIENNRDRPFFLYFACTLPHANNEAGKQGMEVPGLGVFGDRPWPEPQKRLAAMITHLDNDVGQVLDKLKTLGLDQNTLVCFSSDNGPHREGGNNPDFFHSSGGLRGIKRALYEGGIRIPFLARWPGHIPAGRTCDSVGWFADFLPTAAQLAGTASPPNLDGVSLLSVLTGDGKAMKPHPPLYWEFYEQGSAQAVRDGRWKGVCKPMGGTIELYDLQHDLGETKNVATEHPELVASIRALMSKAHVDSPLWKVTGARR